MLVRPGLKTGAPLMHALPRPGRQLPTAFRRLVEDGRDLVERQVEDIVEQPCGPFGRGQFFQHEEQGHRNRLVQLHPGAKVESGALRQGLRQPFADVDFPLLPGGLQLVQRLAAADRDQPCPRRAQRGDIDLVPLEVSVLNHIPRIGQGAQHAVGNAFEGAAVLFKDLRLVDGHGNHSQGLDMSTAKRQPESQRRKTWVYFWRRA